MQERRHQSDISPRISRCCCCFFSFFKVYVCHVHLWVKLYRRDHQRMIYLLYVFLCVTTIVLAKTAGYNIRYGSFIFSATHEIVFQRKSQLGLRCQYVCVLQFSFNISHFSCHADDTQTYQSLQSKSKSPSNRHIPKDVKVVAALDESSPKGRAVQAQLTSRAWESLDDQFQPKY